MDPSFVEFLKFTGVLILINIASISVGNMVSSTSTNPFVSMALRESLARSHEHHHIIIIITTSGFHNYDHHRGHSPAESDAWGLLLRWQCRW
jgi:hypothetical protein